MPRVTPRRRPPAAVRRRREDGSANAACRPSASAELVGLGAVDAPQTSCSASTSGSATAHCGAAARPAGPATAARTATRCSRSSRAVVIGHGGSYYQDICLVSLAACGRSGGHDHDAGDGGGADVQPEPDHADWPRRRAVVRAGLPGAAAGRGGAAGVRLGDRYEQATDLLGDGYRWCPTPAGPPTAWVRCWPADGASARSRRSTCTSRRGSCCPGRLRSSPRCRCRRPSAPPSSCTTSRRTRSGTARSGKPRRSPVPATCSGRSATVTTTWSCSATSTTRRMRPACGSGPAGSRWTARASPTATPGRRCTATSPGTPSPRATRWSALVRCPRARSPDRQRAGCARCAAPPGGSWQRIARWRHAELEGAAWRSPSPTSLGRSVSPRPPFPGR